MSLTPNKPRPTSSTFGEMMMIQFTTRVFSCVPTYLSVMTRLQYTLSQLALCQGHPGCGPTQSDAY